MGIRHLNRYLLHKCSSRSIQRIALSDLRGKTIVLDAFIYMYKYLGEGRLEDRFHQMMKLFTYWDIRPILVFDGKPPEEKKNTLLEWRKLKWEAEVECQKMMAANEPGTERRIDELKKQCVRLSPTNIRAVKDILALYHIHAIDAPTEADGVCAQYVQRGKAWACASDDMDMFVYGCQHVIRNLCLDTQACHLYILPKILKELRMDMKQFRDVMVLSGTDYNKNEKITLFRTIQYFHEYRQCVPYKAIDFYEWLRCAHGDYIEDYDGLMRIHSMFHTHPLAMNLSDNRRKHGGRVHGD